MKTHGKGFQRVLERKRAEDIARYIDSGTAPIPGFDRTVGPGGGQGSTIIGRGKTIQFRSTILMPSCIPLMVSIECMALCLPGKNSRVPVVIFTGLDVREESRLFIDINTKQRPVPTSLFLAIKNLAAYESDTEALIRSVFELFNKRPESPLLGLMSPTEHRPNKISRVTFHAALKTILHIFEEPDEERIYAILAPYLNALIQNLPVADPSLLIIKPVVFRAFMLLFRDVAPKVKDRFESNYTAYNFQDVLAPLMNKKLTTRVKKPGTSYQNLYEEMAQMLRKTVSI